MAMLTIPLIEQLNVNRRTYGIAMNVLLADSFCSVVWWGAWAACAEVSTGSVEASKARLGFRSHMGPGTYGRLLLLLYQNKVTILVYARFKHAAWSSLGPTNFKFFPLISVKLTTRRKHSFSLEIASDANVLPRNSK
jgi:hypothetical protein